MTAETEVRSGEAELEIEEKCQLGMSSYQDLPRVNGINKHAVDDDDEQRHANASANAREDPENSYVFVVGSDAESVGDGAVVDNDLKESNICNVSLPKKDLDVKVEELDTGYGGISQSPTKEEENCIPRGTDVAPASHCVSPEGFIGSANENGDRDGIHVSLGNHDASPEDSVGKANENGDGIDVDISDSAEESNGTVAVESESQLLDGEVKVEYGNDSKPSFKLEKTQEPQIIVSDLPPEICEHQKSIIMSSNAVDSCSEDINITNGKQQDSNSTMVSRQTQEYPNAVLVVVECNELMEVSSSDQTDLRSAAEAESHNEPQITTTTSWKSESCRPDDGEQKLREESATDSSVVDAEKDEKSQILLTDNIQTGFDQGHKPGKSTDATDATLGTDTVNDTVSDGTQESQIVAIESVQHGLDQEHEPAKFNNHVGAPLETEPVCKPISDANQNSQNMVTDGVQIVFIDGHVLAQCTDHTAPLGTKTVNNSVPDENQESQAVGTGGVQDGSDQGHEHTVSTDHVDAPLRAETVNIPVSDENQDSQIMITDSVQRGCDHECEPANSTDHTAPLETETVNDPVPDENQEPQIVATNGFQSGFDQGQELVQSTDHASAPLGTETVVNPVSDENQGSRVMISDSVQTGFDQGLEPDNSTDQPAAPLEVGAVNNPLLDENKDSQTTSNVKDYVFQTNEVNKCIDGHQSTPELNESLENAKTPPPDDCRRSEFNVRNVSVESCESLSADSDSCVTVEHEVGNGVSPVIDNVSTCVADASKPESESENSGLENRETGISCPVSNENSKAIVENSPTGGDYSNGWDYDISSETKAKLVFVDSEEKVPAHQYNDAHIAEVSSEDNGCTHVESIVADNLDVKCHVDDLLPDGSSVDVKSSEVGNSDAVNKRDMPGDGAALSESEALNDSVLTGESTANSVTETLDVENVGDQLTGEQEDSNGNMICQQTGDIEAISSDGLPTTLPEGSTGDANALDGLNMVTEAVRKPFHFLIRVPRFDDAKLRGQIRHAQLQVEEKTQRRDAFKVDMQKIRANCQVHGIEYEAAKSEERDARRLVKLKRQEIDSVQSMINRVKNAISVEDIDGRICNMEHMIEHETLPLKEEKQLIREIKQLKHIREQLSSNMGSQDEVQQALDQKDQIAERLKILKKELDALKDRVSKAEFAALAAGKKYEHESKKLEELQAQFRAADDVRQDAYAHLQSMRKQLFDKNKHFRTYKDDLTASSDYAVKGDKEALCCLCINQVETIMELWNKNDVFRKEYVRCNIRSTLRRLGTMDGRSLGPDEEPTVLPSYEDERVDRSVSSQDKPNSISQIPSTNQDKQVLPAKGELVDGEPMVMVAEGKSRTAKTRKPAESVLANGSATVSDRGESELTKMNEHLQTEEQELAKKAEELRKKEEELRKKETADKLKEQRRMEEMAKAKEAQERKRRNAEKAQFRAEMRAQREAEQKEKEREKRSRKKERKKAAVAEPHDSNNDGENASISETLPETIRETEVKESATLVTKKSQKSPQFIKQSKTKSIPPPLRNRGKRRMQQWIWIFLTALLVITLFLLGNIGFFSNLGQQSPRF